MMASQTRSHAHPRGWALAAVVVSTLLGSASISRGQNFFVDEASSVPPPPSSRVMVPVGSLKPAVAAPPPANASRMVSRNPASLHPTSLNLRPRIPAGNTSSLAGQSATGRPSLNPAHDTLAPTAGDRGGQSSGVRASSSTRVTPAGQIPTGGSIQLASHLDGPSDSAFGFSGAAADGSSLPPPLLFNRLRPGSGGAMTGFPLDRMTPPTIIGSHLGLQPGETATERSLRLMSAVAALERQAEELGRQNAELSDAVKQKDGQLHLAIREIQSARTEVTSAAAELQRLQQQIKDLHERVRVAERDNAAVLETVAPLLQRLFESEALSASPDATSE